MDYPHLEKMNEGNIVIQPKQKWACSHMPSNMGSHTQILKGN